jgi:tetratricopeptide (TPR) repeat protein
MKISRLSDTDDELAYILAKSHYYLGKRYVFSGALHSAKKHLELALEYSKKTIYDTSKILALTPMYLSLANNIQAPLLELKADAVADSFDAEEDYDMLKYITGDSSHTYKNPKYENHIRAKELIRQRRFEEALKLLEEIISEKVKDGYNAYLTFRVYSDIEYCEKQLGNYEGAYKYSTKRMSMLEGFKT